MKLLAIDPGVEKVGYALFEKKVNGTVSFQYLSSGLIKTSKTLEQGKRLEHIFNELKILIDENSIKQVVMERLFFFKNAKTVIFVAQAQGIIELLSAQYTIPLTYLTPLQIKEIITGYGKADKKAVQKMIDLTLKQEITVADDDESDAIACGLAFCFLKY
ncbi:MAG TPA: crossover junction endodeoxyribonuclease RuvC [Candidatus Woesebacteria bacterium]|nr:crossover junction endodeoxyribonuclease RuvC [Candidatus Woesebacteria bacterium]